MSWTKTKIENVTTSPSLTIEDRLSILESHLEKLGHNLSVSRDECEDNYQSLKSKIERQQNIIDVLSQAIETLQTEKKQETPQVGNFSEDDLIRLVAKIIKLTQ